MGLRYLNSIVNNKYLFFDKLYVIYNNDLYNVKIFISFEILQNSLFLFILNIYLIFIHFLNILEFENYIVQFLSLKVKTIYIYIKFDLFNLFF